MIAWIAFAVLILGVFWLAVLYEDFVEHEPEPDPLPFIKVYRMPYDWEARGDFHDFERLQRWADNGYPTRYP